MFVSKVHTFFLKIWKILRKIKTDVDRLLLVSKLKKSSTLAKYIGYFFSPSKQKVIIQ